MSWDRAFFGEVPRMSLSPKSPRRWMRSAYFTRALFRFGIVKTTASSPLSSTSACAVTQGIGYNSTGSPLSSRTISAKAFPVSSFRVTMYSSITCMVMYGFGSRSRKRMYASGSTAFSPLRPFSRM